MNTSLMEEAIENLEVGVPRRVFFFFFACVCVCVCVCVRVFCFKYVVRVGRGRGKSVYVDNTAKILGRKVGG